MSGAYIILVLLTFIAVGLSSVALGIVTTNGGKGPTGFTGPAGIQGPVGPQGPQGPAGGSVPVIRFFMKGNFPVSTVSAPLTSTTFNFLSGDVLYNTGATITPAFGQFIATTAGVYIFTASLAVSGLVNNSSLILYLSKNPISAFEQGTLCNAVPLPTTGSNYSAFVTITYGPVLLAVNDIVNPLFTLYNEGAPVSTTGYASFYGALVSAA